MADEANGQNDYARSPAVLGKQYRKFFGAAVAAVLLLQVTIVTDTIIVGQLLGPVPMSGVRVASPIVNILNVLAMLVGVGGSTLVAIAIGRRDSDSADRAFTLTIVLGIVLGVVFALIVAPFADSIAALISSDPTTIPYTAAFLRIVTAASPVYILASIMALLLRSDGCIKLSSAVLAIAGVANVAFDLLFMGALGMGVEGSALATDAGILVAVLLSLLYFRWPHRTLKLRRLSDGAPAQVAAILKNGAPSALRMFVLTSGKQTTLSFETAAFSPYLLVSTDASQDDNPEKKDQDKNTTRTGSTGKTATPKTGRCNSSGTRCIARACLPRRGRHVDRVVEKAWVIFWPWDKELAGLSAA